MKIGNESFFLQCSDHTGALESCRVDGHELLAQNPRPPCLFRIGVLDHAGNQTIHGSNEAASISAGPTSEAGVEWAFRDVAGLGLDLAVSVRFDAAAQTISFTWSLENRGDRLVEWIQLPILTVPDRLGYGPGEPKLFWPGNEGCLIGDLGLRENSWRPYTPVGYPARGAGGYYPGAAPMQFMAYLGERAGLYVATHDPACGTKEIDYLRGEGGVDLIFKVFPGALGRGKHALGYPLVLAPCAADWVDAAERYRRWVQSGTVALPPRLAENTALPDWVKDSPVVVTYPVRGNGHHGNKSFPNEFFPYTRALPHLDRLAKEWNAPLLALLMQWEGTAPWAPPYVWPPLGGERVLAEFTEALHERGHRLGLYCSGTAWTNWAGTGDGTYRRDKQFEEEGLASAMCAGPRGELGCLICNHESIRFGFDMCTHAPFTRRVMAEEARKMAAAKVDYIQLLDQNHGGASYGCYSKDHGHPGAHGPWQQGSMKDLLAGVKKAMAETGNESVLGCESAAAEPYLAELPLNDLRYNINWAEFGMPVPAFAYVYHEYVNNFSGNQVGITEFFLPAENPWHHTLRMAYSFIAGDLLAVVLKSGGELHWAWCCRWNEEAPEQKPLVDFVGLLNRWRRGAAREYLVHGRMEKPHPIAGMETVTLRHIRGSTFPHDSVLTSAWRSPTGRCAQILCNYLPEAQRVKLLLPAGTRTQTTVSEYGNPFGPVSVPEGGLALELPPFSAAMVEWGG